MIGLLRVLLKTQHMTEKTSAYFTTNTDITFKRKDMDGQQEFEIRDSNITKIGFCRCEDCEYEAICPHAGIREGCRTKEVVKEINF